MKIGSKRGGSKVTSAKDLPWKLQYIEEECKREYPRNNNKKKRQDIRSQEEPRTKSLETVVFIPSTPGSRLRIHLQDADDRLVTSINSPSVRFVERGGPTLMETVGATIQTPRSGIVEEKTVLHVMEERYLELKPRKNH